MGIKWDRSIGWNLDFISLRKEGMSYSIIENGCDCYPWMEYFAFLPRTTVTGKRIWWEKAFKRKVWIVWGTGFHMEPHVQYANAFDLLVYDNKHKP